MRVISHVVVSESNILAVPERGRARGPHLGLVVFVLHTFFHEVGLCHRRWVISVRTDPLPEPKTTNAKPAPDLALTSSLAALTSSQEGRPGRRADFHRG